MSKRRTALAAALTGVLSVGVVSALTSAAHGDAAPQNGDVVGVGSDVIQYAADFLADGFTPSGGAFDPGYNSTGNKYREFSFDSTADANGRNAFTDPALGTSGALNPTIILRAGTSPVQRPNGGSAGIAALLADGATGAPLIDFVRSPNAPSTANETAAKAAKPSGLGTTIDWVQIADDKQYIATSTTTNVPAGITPTDIGKIYNGEYTQWKQLQQTNGGDLPDATVTSPDSYIHPLIPQSTAGVRKVFLNQLKADYSSLAWDGTTYTQPAASGSYPGVKDVQQNDPTVIQSDPDALVPFPESRYKLLQQSYFKNPNSAFPSTTGTAPSASQIQLLPGADYTADLPFFILFRHSDLTSTTGWQPGSTLNWVQALFWNQNWYDDPDHNTPPFVFSAAGTKIIQDSGLTPVDPDAGSPFHAGS